MQASHEQDHAGNAEEATNKIDLSDDLSARHAPGVDSGGWEVEEQGSKEPDPSPCTTQGTTVPPACMGSDELGPEDRGTEGDDGEDQDCDVLASLAGWGKLGSRSKSSQLVDTGANSGQHHAADEGVHGFGRAGNAHGNAKEGSSDQCHVSTANEIGQGSHKGTDTSQGQQIAQDLGSWSAEKWRPAEEATHKPDPAVGPTNVRVDVGGNTA